MTERVLRALDDPYLTVLGHPTGRLLLSRDPYPIDMDAVLEKAGAVRVAGDVLNVRSVDEVLAFARARRATRH